MKEQGLTTDEAFEKLFDCITIRLDEYKKSHYVNSWGKILRNAFTTQSNFCIVSWISYFLLIAESVSIFILFLLDYGTIWKDLIPEALFMIIICIINAAICIWDNNARLNELPTKIEKILNEVKELSKDIRWDEENYPDLHMPFSPCISTQLTYRDRKLVNLPWALLVPGDLVLLQPSQKIIAKCYLLNNEEKILESGTIFSPNEIDGFINEFDENYDYNNPRPRLHLPLKSIFGIVIDSPFVELVNVSLSDFLKRPFSFYIKERHVIVTQVLECIVIPLTYMTLVMTCLIKMFYLPHWLGSRITSFSEAVILQAMTCTFPLLPIALPFLWIFLNALGNARIYLLFELFKRNIEPSKSYNEKSELKSSDELEVNIPITTLYSEIWRFFQGREGALHRSQKLLHVLATVTAFCCVDKKGILSWPNPSADKIFLLKTEIDPVTKKRETVSEVLDVSNDPNNASKLQFDEPSWESNLSSLKPLGLNILLNTCNQKTKNKYSEFHSHISYEFQSKGGEFMIPITSRRCLCEISRIIGFTEKAPDVFRLEQELCAFRYIKEPDEISRQKLLKAKIKFPFPHMMSIIVRERLSQTLQLMTQGTGDLILDTCDSFWNGTDIRPITQEERRLILEFYQRTSLTSICSAFSYKPVNAKVSNHLASLYIELEASRGLCYSTIKNEILNSNKLEVPSENEFSSLSTDCLSNSAYRKRSMEKEVNNLEGCVELYSEAVFLGLIAMQYQACMDIVQIVEELETACIRFVFFSKENELRSQVFADNLGLESGWNSHVSLENPKLARRDTLRRPTTDSSSLEEAKLAKEMFANKKESEDSSSLLLPSIETGAEVPVEESKYENTLDFQKKLQSYTSTAVKHGEDDKLLSRCSASYPEITGLLGSPKEIDVQSSDINYENDIAIRTPENEKSDSNPISCAASASVLLDKPLKDVRFAHIENEPSTLKRNSRSSLRRQDSTTPTDSFHEMYDFVEHSTPIGFDMQNRAKLPRGIEEVRPHLENVDNVPLLVSLFTDCYSEATQEMIKIMQDYGEVVLLIGAASNVENKHLFLQADASFAFEPMYPTQCQKKPCYIKPTHCKAPTEIAMILSSLPCSLHYERNEPFSISQLIAQGRHFMNNCFRNTLQFWLCCQFSISLLGIISVLMLLPPLYTIGDVIWLSCIIVPVLSLSLTFGLMNHCDPEIMQCASYKNQFMLNKQMIIFSFWFYGCKCIPSIVNVAFMAIFNLRTICMNVENSTCYWMYPINETEMARIKASKGKGEISHQSAHCQSSWSCEHSDLLLVVQQFSLFFMVLYFVLISACFLYRSKFLWESNPILNKAWIISATGVILVQILYFIVNVHSLQLLSHIPFVSFIWGFLWIFVLLGFNELLKRYQIKINIRFKKRDRLNFGTKLGMNSPF